MGLPFGCVPSWKVAEISGREVARLVDQAARRRRARCQGVRSSTIWLNLLPDFLDGLLGGDGVFPGVWKGGDPITGCHGAEFRACPERVA